MGFATTENERTVTGMDEYISRKSLSEAFDNADADIVADYGDGACDWGFGRKKILEVINSVPAADVVPIRRGEWIVCGDGNDAPWMCSHCGKTTANKYKTIYGKYCPNCGAKMDGDGNG